MKHPTEIAREENSMATLVELTSVFEGIASMRLPRLRTKCCNPPSFLTNYGRFIRNFVSIACLALDATNKAKPMSSTKNCTSSLPPKVVLVATLTKN